MILFILIPLLIIFHKQVKFYAFHLIPASWCNHKMIYASIKDVHCPQISDYLRIQKYLREGRRPELLALKDYATRVRHFRLIGRSTDEHPLCGTIAVNCSENDKENCLIVYASYNKSYPKGLKRLIDHVSSSDFKGHILYRVGGWPNVEEGDLKLAHVPYAFKPCFFREAQRLGYQKVLWLDTSVLPTVSLNQIFQEIQRKGYFILDNGCKIGPFMNASCAKALGITIDQAFQIPSCSAGLFGVDFSYEPARNAIEEWYKKAKDSAAFFSALPEQNVLSVILYQFGLRDMTSIQTMIEKDQPLANNTLFIIDRGFVHQ